MQWWAVKFAKADKPIWMYDWQLFSKKLTDMFDPGEHEANAGKYIANLKQNKLAANYYSRIMGAATETLWNNSAQIYYFKAGLKVPILNALAMQEDEPQTLSVLAGLCIKLDQLLFDQGKRVRTRTGLRTVPVIKVKHTDHRNRSHAPPSTVPEHRLKGPLRHHQAPPAQLAILAVLSPWQNGIKDACWTLLGLWG